MVAYSIRVQWVGVDHEEDLSPSGFATEEAAKTFMQAQGVRMTDYILVTDTVTVGSPATLCGSADWSPCTVVGVSPSGKTITLRRDRVVRASCPHGITHAHECDPNVLTLPGAGHEVIVCRQRGGVWRASGGRDVILGVRKCYRNPEI